MAKFCKITTILVAAVLLVYNQSILYAAQEEDNTAILQEKYTQKVLQLQDNSRNIEEISETVYSDTTASGLVSNGGLIEECQTVSAAVYDHVHDEDILNALINLEDSMNVSGWGLTRNDYAEVVYGVINNNPQIFYIESIGCSYNSSGVLKLNFYYSYEKSQIVAMQSEIDSAVTQIDAAINTTDTQKIMYKTVAADGDNQLRVYAVSK